MAWREDASNQDLSFLRNRVRHEVLPLMRERLNPRVDEALARARRPAGRRPGVAYVLRGRAGEDLWTGGERTTIDVPRLAALPLAARRRLVPGAG